MKKLIVALCVAGALAVALFVVAPTHAATGPASVLTVTCGETQNALTWTMPPGADSNAINKRTDGGSTIQIPATGTSYTDTNVSPGHTYDYVHKAWAGVASNSVTCPNSTPPPAATADIKANGSNGPITVSSGASVAITWNSTNATFCSVDPGGYWGLTGNEFINATISTTYTLTCSGGSNGATDSVTVNVTGAPPQQATADIKANGSDGSITISSGEAATITWNSTNASSCTVSPGNLTGTSGSASTGALMATQSYTLTCSSLGRGATDSVTVNVGSTPPPPPPPPPPPTPTPTLTIDPATRTMGTGGITSFKLWYDPDGSGSGEKQDVSSGGMWTSSNDSVAGSEGGGKFSAKKIGQATVRATYQSLSASASLKVVQGGSRPTVRTTNATNIQSTYASLGGLVNPQGAPTVAWFEYGPTISLGKTTKKQDVGAGRAWSPVSKEVALESGAEYFYRAAAQNAFGTVYGDPQKLNAAGSPELIVEPQLVSVFTGALGSFTAWYDPDGSGPEPRRNVTSESLWLSSSTVIATHENNGAFRALEAGAVEVVAIYNESGPVVNANEISNVRGSALLAVNQSETKPDDITLTPPEEATSTPPRSSPWRVIGIIFGIVVFLAAVGAGAWYLKKRFADGY